MGLGRGDVLAVESLVEIDGGVDFLHDGAGAGRKPPAPHFVAHGTSTEVSPIVTERPELKKRFLLILAGGIAGLAAGLAGVYGIATLTGNAGGDTASDVSCRQAVELARKLAPLARGEVAAVKVAQSGLKVPDLTFQDAAGKPLSMADWAGR